MATYLASFELVSIPFGRVSVFKVRRRAMRIVKHQSFVSIPFGRVSVFKVA